MLQFWLIEMMWKFNFLYRFNIIVDQIYQHSSPNIQINQISFIYKLWVMSFKLSKMGKVRCRVLTHWEGLWSYIRGCITCDGEKRSRPTWGLWRDAWTNLDQIWHGATFFTYFNIKKISKLAAGFMFSTRIRPFGIDLPKKCSLKILPISIFSDDVIYSKILNSVR